jgi:hypothetical protein
MPLTASNAANKVVTDVVVRNSVDVAQSHRQERLCALEGLYVTFLIGTQHQRLWIKVQTDDVARSR